MLRSRGHGRSSAGARALVLLVPLLVTTALGHGDLRPTLNLLGPRAVSSAASAASSAAAASSVVSVASSVQVESSGASTTASASASAASGSSTVTTTVALPVLIQCEQVTFAFTGPPLKKYIGFFVVGETTWLETHALSSAYDNATSGTFTWLVDFPVGLEVEAMFYTADANSDVVSQATTQAGTVQAGTSSACLAENAGQNTESILSLASSLDPGFTYSVTATGATAASTATGAGAGAGADGSGNSVNVAAVAGGVVGGVAFLAIVTLFLFWLAKRNRVNAAGQFDQPPADQYSVYSASTRRGGGHKPQGSFGGSVGGAGPSGGSPYTHSIPMSSMSQRGGGAASERSRRIPPTANAAAALAMSASGHGHGGGVGEPYAYEGSDAGVDSLGHNTTPLTSPRTPRTPRAVGTLPEPMDSPFHHQTDSPFASAHAGGVPQSVPVSNESYLSATSDGAYGGTRGTDDGMSDTGSAVILHAQQRNRSNNDLPMSEVGPEDFSPTLGRSQGSHGTAAASEFKLEDPNSFRGR